MVVKINSMDELKKTLADAADKLVVLNFKAAWCEQSDVISSKFEEFSYQFYDAQFYNIDVDEAKTIAIQYKVDRVPTFLFFKNGQQVGAMSGASVETLKNLLEKHR